MKVLRSDYMSYLAKNEEILLGQPEILEASFNYYHTIAERVVLSAKHVGYSADSISDAGCTISRDHDTSD